MASRRVEWLNELALLTTAAAAAALYLAAHTAHPARPRSLQQLGWFTWFDQERYYKAALAWAHGNFDAAQHWYLPGYSFMAAPFAWPMPLQPFLIVNLVCLLLSLWLCSQLAAQLAPELPFARFMGAAVFLGCSALTPTMLEVWVVPNSTSGSTPIIYACLLAAVRFVQKPWRARYAFVAALAGCSVAAFRPTDALPLLTAAATGMGSALLLARTSWQAASRTVLAAVAGATLSLGLLLAAYLAIYGFKESGYVWISKALGFEWRLLPLRWVMLFLDPRPLLPDGEGMFHRFFWIAPGLAGCAAILASSATRSRRLADGIVVAAIVLHIAIYCVYRDLHPPNLFRFTNYHYFKWIVPILGLYAVRFAWALLAGPHRLRSASVGAMTLMVLMPWRGELRALPRDKVSTAVGDTITFNADLSDVRNTLLVAGVNVLEDTHRNVLAMGGVKWGFFDLRLYAQPGGFMVALLRPVGTGDGTFTVKPPVMLRPGTDSLVARQTIVFGLPCLFSPERPACWPMELIRPADFPLNRVLTFDGADIPYLVTGWSLTQSGGRWTEGGMVSLRLRLQGPAPNTPLRLELETIPFVPAGSAPLAVRLQVNGQQLAAWRFPKGDQATLGASISPELIGPDKDINIVLRIDNPRSSSETSPDSTDTRKLGLFVRTLRLRADVK